MPTLILHGLDEFAIGERLTAEKAALGDPTTAALNTTLFEAKSATLPEVRAACGMMPFLADTRLIIVEGWLSKLMGKGEEASADESPKSSKETLAALADWVTRLPSTARLVLAERRDLPEKNAFFKAVAGHAEVVRCDLPKGEALHAWIRQRAQQWGGTFAPEAARALAEATPDPRALDQEILKLLTYAGFTRPVRVADVELLTPAGSEARIFDMVDAVGQRRAQAAQSHLKKVLDKEDPLFVLGMIVRQFRLMIQARELLEARSDEAGIAKTLGVHPFAAEKITAQARQFTLPVLEGIYRRLLLVDVDIKTGRMPAETALEHLVADLTTR